MAVEIIGTSGNIADVDASGNLKVNIETSQEARLPLSSLQGRIFTSI